MAVTVSSKSQLVVPASVRRRAGLKAGDRLEFTASRGVITITAKAPAVRDEYTPSQRKVIDAGIRQGLDDFKKGRVHGPFATAHEASSYIERRVKERAADGKKIKRPKR